MSKKLAFRPPAPPSLPPIPGAPAPAARLDNPFVRARDEWDNRFSNLAAGKRNWQLIAVSLLLLDCFLSAALFWLASQSKITPYVVEVDKLGQAVAFGPAEQLAKVDERLYRYLLSIWIYDVRSVMADRNAQTTALQHAYAYSRDGAVEFLNAHYRTHNPFVLAKEQTVLVRVQSILRSSPTTWQVQWSEEHQPLQGTRAEIQNWQAIVTTQLTPPVTSDAILENPLGLFVSNITWTRTNN